VMWYTSLSSLCVQLAEGSGFWWRVAYWLESTQIGQSAGGSTWVYPYIQLLHFTGLSLWIATTVAVDLHLLGVVRREQTTAQLQKALIVWNWIGFVILIAGGVLLFSTAATLFIINPAFETKVGLLLPVALAWHILMQVKVRAWGQTMDPPNVAKVAGFVEILLWVSVATAATTIPYF
jgi:hypothetical protein